MNYDIMPTPLGDLLLVSDGQHLKHLDFVDGLRQLRHDEEWVQQADPVLQQTRQQLTEWFDGQRQTFDLPLAPEGTPFQQLVWQTLCTIPFGQTVSYGELARMIGNPSASRAVGAANGKNPVMLIIPCHRVIGSNGSLTGFAGGIELKQRLLAFEQSKE